MLSIVIVSMASAVWIMLLNKSNNEATGDGIMVSMPIGLGLGWGIFQVLFVRKKRIKAQGGIGFWELMLLSIEGGAMVMVSILVLLWVKVI